MSGAPDLVSREVVLIASGLDKCKQVGVDRVCLRRGHAVRETLVRFQRAVLKQLCRERPSIGIRHDLIVVAVHDEHWHGEKATMPS